MPREDLFDSETDVDLPIEDDEDDDFGASSIRLEKKEEEPSLHWPRFRDAEESPMALTNPRIVNATRVVTADSVQAEEVPTIPISSLEIINALQPEVSIHPVIPAQAVTVRSPLVVQPTAYRRGFKEGFKIWWRGLRLNYLPLSLMPVLLGTVLAWITTITVKKPWGTFHLLPFLGFIIAVLLLQLGSHLINDYYDYLHSIDTSNTLGSGGLIQQGHSKPMKVLTIGLILLGLGAIGDFVVALKGGPFFYLFSVIAILCAYFYSATEYSLASKVLGEFVGFAIFGPLLTLGGYSMQMGLHIPLNHVLIYSLPLGLLAAATLHANNMRDIEGDALAHKHTLATSMGLFMSRILYLLLLLLTYAIILILAIPHKAPHFILLSLWTFPTFLLAVSGVMRTNAPSGFHLVIRQTLKLETLFALLLLFGLIINAFIPLLPHIGIMI